MKKLVITGLFVFASLSSFAQEVRSEIEIVNEIKTVVMTIDADRFQDLKDFDWRGNLTNVFKNIPDEAVIGIRVNIGAKQLTSDSTTLPNYLSLLERGRAKNKQEILTKMVKNVQLFIDDEQQGANID